MKRRTFLKESVAGVGAFAAVTHADFAAGGANVTEAMTEQRRASGDGDYLSVEPINNMRAALAKMSPEERREQAIYQEHYDYSPPLAARGSKEAEPLVGPHPELFHPTLPRTAIQLVIAEFRSAWNLKDPRPGQSNYIRVRHAETLETSDWKAISAVLDRR